MSGEIRRLGSGETIAASLACDFIAAALRHPAVADALTEVLLARLDLGDYRSEALAPSLRVLIEEILDAAEPQDWQAVAGRLIEDGRELTEEGRWR